MHSSASRARRFDSDARVRQKPHSVHKGAVATAPIDARVPVRGLATFSLKNGKGGSDTGIEKRVIGALFDAGVIHKSDFAELLVVEGNRHRYVPVLTWDGSIRTGPCDNITGQMHNGVVTLRWSGERHVLSHSVISVLPLADVVVDPSE